MSTNPPLINSWQTAFLLSQQLSLVLTYLHPQLLYFYKHPLPSNVVTPSADRQLPLTLCSCVLLRMLKNLKSG